MLCDGRTPAVSLLDGAYPHGIVHVGAGQNGFVGLRDSSRRSAAPRAIELMVRGIATAWRGLTW